MNGTGDEERGGERQVQKEQAGREKERLIRKLEHWTSHNMSHAKSFRDAAEDAEILGFAEVANTLRNAADEMEKISEQLKNAAEMLRKDKSNNRK